MKKNYITIGGQEYRVEANWNAVVAFLEAVGKDDMAALANMSQLKPSEITALMAACINEGEALDGRECNLTAAEIGRICDVTLITQFLLIYKDQSSLKTPVAEEEKKKD